MEDKRSILETAISALDDKKGRNIRAIEIKELTTVADYFIIASGTSVTHIKSLADNVEEKLAEKGVKPIHIEGYNSARWILLDYNDIVIHIFHEDDREYYGLERLWQDGREINIGTELS